MAFKHEDVLKTAPYLGDAETFARTVEAVLNQRQVSEDAIKGTAVENISDVVAPISSRDAYLLTQIALLDEIAEFRRMKLESYERPSGEPRKA